MDFFRKSFLPEDKLSKTTTSLFSETRMSTRWLPIKPAPPVTNIFLYFLGIIIVLDFEPCVWQKPLGCVFGRVKPVFGGNYNFIGILIKPCRPPTESGVG